MNVLCNFAEDVYEKYYTELPLYFDKFHYQKFMVNIIIEKLKMRENTITLNVPASLGDIVKYNQVVVNVPQSVIVVLQIQDDELSTSFTLHGCDLFDKFGFEDGDKIFLLLRKYYLPQMKSRDYDDQLLGYLVEKYLLPAIPIEIREKTKLVVSRVNIHNPCHLWSEHGSKFEVGQECCCVITYAQFKEAYDFINSLSLSELLEHQKKYYL